MSGKAARDTKRRSTDVLFDRYYFGRPGFVNGTVEFHALCGTYIRQGASILEIGAGPPNPTTRYLASVGRVVGLDVSGEVASNADLAEGVVYA